MTTSHCFRFSLLLTCASYVLAQGSLAPAGPPNPGMKALDQIASTGIEINAVNTPGNATALYVISSPGNYFLPRSAVALSGKSIILITSPSVTIDLGGFSLFGVPGSLTGISDGGVNRGNVVVRNGTVTGCGGNGIDLAASYNGRFQNVFSTNNGGLGFALGDAVEMRDCTARDNSGTGISTGFNANLMHCTSVGSSSGHGIDLGQDSSAFACVANFNKLTGIQTSASCALSFCNANDNQANGINGSSGCTLSNCQTSRNLAIGIAVGTGCSVENCGAYQNGTAGTTFAAITTFTGCTVRGCNASFNNAQYGIVANNGCTVSDCTALANTSSLATSAGFIVGQATLRHCTSISNTNTNAGATNQTGMGIYCNGGNAVIESCVSSSNKGDGIYTIGIRTFVRNNSCNDNGTSGVHVNSSDCRVEGNMLASNTTNGLLVDVTLNVIFGNTARGNVFSNYNIVTGNRVATIVVPAVTAGPITGNTGGNAFSTDAFANIAY